MENLLHGDSDLSSGESDEDYIPTGCVEDSESDNAEGDNEDDKPTSTKKLKTKKRQKTSKKHANNDETEELVEETKISPEEEKKRVDDLYKDFMKDVKPLKRKAADDIEETPLVKQKVTVITEEYEFAGETVKVQKEVDSNEMKSSVGPEKIPQRPVTSAPKVSVNKPRGLSSVLCSLDKKKKMSIIDKTLHDWKNFKKDEGIEEDLLNHNRGKGGFIEKQAFLQRSDLKQFELERDLRQSRRSRP